MDFNPGDKLKNKNTRDVIKVIEVSKKYFTFKFAHKKGENPFITDNCEGRVLLPGFANWEIYKPPYVAPPEVKTEDIKKTVPKTNLVNRKK